MIEIKEVKTRSDIRNFIQFPNGLYKGNDCYVPPLESEEKKLFKKNHPAYEQSEAVFYLAYRNGEVVGRIMGILQRAYNQKTGEKRVRFTRFDSIDDQEVANALFGAVENWAKSKGMDTVHGPLGFNDLEREGLLIDGFDQLSTFEEQYNYEYYKKLIENVGYVKETDWSERKVYAPDKVDERMERIANLCAKKHNLSVAKCKNMRSLLKKYKDQIFDLVDLCYSSLYGVVPITEKERKGLVGQFNLLLKPEYIKIVVNENDEVVGFGFAMPSLSRALQPSKGRLTLPAIIRVLKAVKNPQIMDFALVAVHPDYRMKGVAALITLEMQRLMVSYKNVSHYETNLNLEDNEEIQNWWDSYKTEKHKMRRSFVKKLGGKNE